MTFPNFACLIYVAFAFPEKNKNEELNVALKKDLSGLPQVLLNKSKWDPIDVWEFVFAKYENATVKKAELKVKMKKNFTDLIQREAREEIAKLKGLIELIEKDSKKTLQEKEKEKKFLQSGIFELRKTAEINLGSISIETERLKAFFEAKKEEREKSKLAETEIIMKETEKVGLAPEIKHEMISNEDSKNDGDRIRRDPLFIFSLVVVIMAVVALAILGLKT